MLITDRRVTERYIAAEFGISKEHVHAIIHTYPEMTNVSARWVQKLLGRDQKHLQCNMSNNNIAIFHADLQRLILRFVSMYETWVPHFQPESKEQ